MSVQWMEQQIHGLEDMRDIIRDIILNRDIILRDIILSGIQVFSFTHSPEGTSNPNVLSYLISFLKILI